jgi:thiamine-monophosphate kinase
VSRHVEEARIARLRALFTRPSAGARADVIEVDVGDDAAVLGPSLGREVLSVDAHVEGVHFRRAWLSLHELGARAAAAALSDLAAMGAEPRVVLLSLALPSGLLDDELDVLGLGVRDACDDVGARVVGGNLTRASELSIHTTVVGRMSERPMRRIGAEPGHGVYLTGTVGAAALGLAVLERDALSRDPSMLAPFVSRWRRPRPRVSEGRRLVELASAAIDVSDGVAVDLGRLAAASGVGLELDASELPCERDHARAAALLDADPLALALFGGEDYELAFTAPVTRSLAGLATRVGVVVPTPGVRVRFADGRMVETDALGRGFDHFSS